MSKHLVFVYGSLRRGGENAMSQRFPEAQFVAEARVNGSLYDLGEYPGLLLNESASPVTGEAYEVDDELLKILDDFEATSDYRRKQVEIALGTDKRMGWTYEPNPELCSDRKVITSGDWIDHARTKSNRTSSLALDAFTKMRFRRHIFKVLLPLLYIVAGALPIVGMIITIAEGPNPFGFLFPLSYPGFYLLDILDRVLPVPHAHDWSLMLIGFLANMVIYFMAGCLIDFAVTFAINRRGKLTNPSIE